MYYKSVGIRRAHLTSAVQTEGLEDKIRTLLEKQTGEKVLMDSKVDPGIVGGFIVEVDDYILDASVARQLELNRIRIRGVLPCRRRYVRIRLRNCHHHKSFRRLQQNRCQDRYPM